MVKAKKSVKTTASKSKAKKSVKSTSSKTAAVKSTPVKETAPVQATAPVVAESTLSSSFSEFMTKLQQVSASLTSLRSEFRALEKKASRELRQAQKIIAIMQDAVKLVVRNKVDYEKGPTWGDVK